MSRKPVKHDRRRLLEEPRYNNPFLTKFIRMVMWDGKLSVAERFVYEAIDKLADKVGEPGLDAFMKALENLKPLVKVKARRVGGSTYQVPVEVTDDLGWRLAMKWLIASSRKKSGKPMAERLFLELSDAYEKKGDAYRKREETHKMAEANRAFAHYRI